jgi:hypothetical protein
MPRLAAPFPGEQIATLAAIERALGAEGFDFHDLTRAVVQSAPALPPQDCPPRGQPRRAGPVSDCEIDCDELCRIIDRIEAADYRRKFLNMRSRTFLADLRARCLRFDWVFLSERQATWLANLEEQAA